MQADMRKKKIVCVHLLNDYSGSPLILSMVIKGFLISGYEVDLITSSGKQGFLSGLNVNYRYFTYRFHQNKWIRLYRYLKSQAALFLIVNSYRKEDVNIYINTLLPFGAALAGKVNGKKITYHLHESYIQPKLLKRFLKKVASFCADSAFYVSNYLLKVEQLTGIKNTVIYNALPDEFVDRAGSNIYRQSNKAFTVLMISSLKGYKGIDEFIKLANRIKEVKFELVLNASLKEIASYFNGEKFPENLVVYPVQQDVHPFYERASVVVNLSNPGQCIETFGMTLLEGMCYGLPVIGPPVGGPAEVVQDGINGYCIDSRNIDKVENTIRNIYSNKALQQQLGKGALMTAEKFEEQTMYNKIKKNLDI